MGREGGDNRKKRGRQVGGEWGEKINYLFFEKNSDNWWVGTMNYQKLID